MNNDRATRLLAALTPAGLTANRARKILSCSWDAADKVLQEMVAKGLAWPRRLRQGGMGYYPSPDVPEALLSLPKPPVVLRRQKSKESPAAQTVIPPHVKVQVCPPYQGDYRIQVKGPVVGGFLSEWKTLRGTK